MLVYILKPKADEVAMPKAKPLPEGSIGRLRLELKRARTKGQHQLVLCVWMRAVLHLKSDVIALALDMTGQAVRKIHMDYLRDGEAIFKKSGKGGRHRQNLSVPAERAFLERVLHAAEPASALLEVRHIHDAYEEMLGRAVSSSVIYRLLRRHNWRRMSSGLVAPPQKGWAAARLPLDDY
jgi:hypothetical protein